MSYKISGIYAITNIKNGKKYIGQSKNIKKRFQMHKYNLKKGTHFNKHLQSSYNKYGKENFKFTILKECSEKELNQLEIQYIKKYETTNPKKGYNLEHGGKENKQVTLQSKLKRRKGKWSHGLSSKTTPAYAFRNMNVELWDTRRIYKNRCYESPDIHLDLEDINAENAPEDYNVTDYGMDETMTNYNKLISKYYAPDGKNITGAIKVNPSERFNNEHNNEIRREARRKNRHLILDELLLEVPFNLNKDQIKNIRYLLDRFNEDFKNFSRNSSNETIILAFIMMHRKQANPKLNVERLSISKKYKLTNSKFQTIQNRLIFRLMQTTELRYSQSKYYDHEILVKEGR